MAAINNGTPVRKAVRCAIYTRKSTEEGLNQEFNSLDAQREAAEAYILSQKHDGWTLVPTQYSDGGYTGANIERPGVRKLLADIDASKVDCVVVYKVDRLSRSLIDFSGRLLHLARRFGTVGRGRSCGKHSAGRRSPRRAGGNRARGAAASRRDRYRLARGTEHDEWPR